MSVFINIVTVFKQRHVKVTAKERYVAKPVFDAWKPDTPDVIGLMFVHDKAQWNVKDACETIKESSGLEGMIVQNFKILKDTYLYLQSKSDRYPWISYHTARKYFFREV